MEKFTREYAIKTGSTHVSNHLDTEVRMMHGHYTRMFADGYMKAIEETNAPELLEALKSKDARIKELEKQGLRRLRNF